MKRISYSKTSISPLSSEAWSLHERISFYWTLSSFSFFVDDILVIKRAYFNKNEMDILNDVMLDHLIFQPDVPYNSLDAESIWMLTLQAAPHADVTYAEMLSRLRKLERATEGKYGVSEVNGMHKYAVESVVLRLGSLRFREADEPKVKSARDRQLGHGPSAIRAGTRYKVASTENLSIIKALLKYRLHKAVFHKSSDPHMLFLSMSLQAQSVISSFSDTELCLWALVCRHGSLMAEHLNACISRLLDAYIKETNNLDAEDHGYLLAHGAIPEGYSTKILKRIIEDICVLPLEAMTKKQAGATALSRKASVLEHSHSSVSVTSNINITNVLDQLLNDAESSSTTSANSLDGITLSGSPSSFTASETQPASLASPLSSSLSIPLFSVPTRRRASASRPKHDSARHYRQPSRSLSSSLPASLPPGLLEELLKKP